LSSSSSSDKEDQGGGSTNICEDKSSNDEEEQFPDFDDGGDDKEGEGDGENEISEEEEWLEEGECELCERYIQLTKHHLIPRSTWTKLEPRLVKLASAEIARFEKTKTKRRPRSSKKTTNKVSRRGNELNVSFA